MNADVVADVLKNKHFSIVKFVQVVAFMPPTIKSLKLRLFLLVAVSAYDVDMALSVALGVILTSPARTPVNRDAVGLPEIKVFDAYVPLIVTVSRYVPGAIYNVSPPEIPVPPSALPIVAHADPVPEANPVFASLPSFRT
jgi:hypothetical protein